MAKDNRKKEDLKSFTVGSVQPQGKGSRQKTGKTEKIEISEKEFPVLADVIKNKKVQLFQKEMDQVLAAVQEAALNGNEEDKAEAVKVQEAYAMTLALLENGRVVR